MKKIFISFAIFCVTITTAFAGEFNVYKLENGQTVVIDEVKTNPIVTIDTWIKTGSINEDDKNNGVSHFLEHLFFKGSTNHAPGEFDKILETKGAINNAATSKDFTHYYITIPSKDFDLALEMHSDMLLNPLVPRKEMEKERKVVLEEIAKDLNNPGSIVYENLVKMMYKNHPYKRKVIGTKEIIENIPREVVMDYYNKFYKPSNMVTIIVGNVNSTEVINKIKNSFNKDFEKVEKISFPKEKPLTKQERTVAHFPVTSGYMLIGFRGVDIDNNDSYALDVLATILGEGRTSIFYKDIKDDKQLAHSISASNSGFRDDGIFYISANFAPEKLDKLENEIFTQIEKVQKNGVTYEQLNTAQNMIERETFYERESISNIANEIGYTFVTTDDIKYYKNYLDNIKKVTASDVRRVANKYLNKSQSAVSILVPEQKDEVEVSHTTMQQGENTLISSFNNTEKYKLSNGATLLYTNNDANDIVAISVFVKGGEFLEEKAGTAALMNAVLLKGTNKYTKDELANLLEDNGIKISSSSCGDSLTITVLTTRNEYERTLEILHEVLNDALLDDYEIDKAANEKLSKIKKNRDVPFNVAVEEYKTMIYEGSVYSNSTKVLEKSLPNITKSDVDKYYQSIFNPKNIVISINGNVDKNLSLCAFSKMFTNNAQAGEFDYAKFANTIKSIEKPKISTKQIKDLKTDWIIIGWQTSGILNQKDWATLQVIDTILGTGMSSRMFKNIRDSEGLAYQLGSQYGANMLKGAFIMYIGTNPENLQKAKDKMFKEIYNLKREFVSTKELNDAKEKLIGRYILSQETNLDKASTVGWFEASGRGYDFDKNYIKLINSVNESDIIEVSNKYFNDNYVLSIVKD